MVPPNDNEFNKNSWGEWSRYVLKNIEEIKVDVKDMQTLMNKIDKRLTIIEIKSGLFGAATATIVTLLIKFFSK